MKIIQFFAASIAIVTNCSFAQAPQLDANKSENASLQSKQVNSAENQRSKGVLAIKRIDSLIRQQCQNPKYAPFYAKSPCKSKEVTPSQLSDSSKITDQEKPFVVEVRNNIFKSYQERIKIYKELGLNGDAKEAELFENLALPKIQQNDKNLIDGKITWGQYNKQRLVITNEFEENRKL